MLHKIGTLYLDGRLAKAGTMYQDGAKVAFGDAVPGYELFWRSIPGTTSFILAGPALLDISWRQLRDLGFIGGRPFLMDGKVYMVRLPRLGIKPPAGAAAMEGVQFWGQETFISFGGAKPEQRSPVSSAIPNSWGALHPAERRQDLGFVPVLDEGV